MTFEELRLLTCDQGATLRREAAMYYRRQSGDGVVIYARRMAERIRFSSVTIACPRPSELAAFYADLTDGEVTFVHQDEWATMRCSGGRIEFMGVEDYRTPQWPGDSSLIHIDFHVDDLEAAGARAELAGATRFATQPNAAHCMVYADPAGHPFCLSLIDEVG